MNYLLRLGLIFNALTAAMYRSFPLLQLGALFSTFLANSSLAQNHSISLNQSQYREVYEFTNSDQAITISGPSIQYSYSFGDLVLGAGYQEAEGNKSLIAEEGNAQFSLDFEQQGYSAFASYYGEQSWLSVSYQTSEDMSRYYFTTRSALVSNQNDIDVESYNLQLGYGWYFSKGQLSLSSDFTKQMTEERSDYLQVTTILNTPVPVNETANTEQDAVLASVGLDGSFYISLSSDLDNPLDLILGANIRRQVTLDGESYTQQSTKYKLPRVDVQEEASELFSESSQQATDYGVNITLQGSSASLSFSASKQRRQDSDDAYYSVGVSSVF